MLSVWCEIEIEMQLNYNTKYVCIVFKVFSSYPYFSWDKKILQ